MECGCYEYRVEPREVDLTKRATIIALGDTVLHAAGEDADRYGFGVRNLQERNVSWVLSRFAIEVERFPAEYESYRIETWIDDVSRVMTTRNFRMIDAQGGLIACASSLWAIIDLRTRRPLDLRSQLEYGDVVNRIETPMMPPERLAAVADGTLGNHRVGYTDIDFNEHANSMKYVQWMIDMLPLEKMTSGFLHRLDINYLHETRHGETLSIICAENPETSHFEVRKADGTPACRAALTWKNK